MINSAYSIYDQSGRIVRVLTCPENMRFLQVKSGEGLVDGAADIENQYVVHGFIVERPENPTTLDAMTLYNVPAPCTMWIDNHQYQVDSSTVSLDLPLPGKYKIVIDSFPCKRKTIEVIV